MRFWLKRLRQENDLTQQDVADMLGISQNYYSNIENGKRGENISLMLASDLAGIFSISLDTIKSYELLEEAKE